MQLYVDLDGVVFDFDRGYELLTGVRPCKAADNVSWDRIRDTKDFYRHLPLTADARELWDYVAPHDPIILTGLPWSIPSAEQNKRDAVAEHFGAHVQVIACASKDKCLRAQPGDILIDDWEKYRSLWEQAGGRWITHVSAADTIKQLEALGL